MKKERKNALWVNEWEREFVCRALGCDGFYQKTHKSDEEMVEAFAVSSRKHSPGCHRFIFENM